MIVLYIFFALIAVCILLVLYLMKPNQKRDLRPFLGRRFAHRGLPTGSGRIPENSPAAFKAAAEAGYGVELDVRHTQDHYLVVFHDSDLKRMCGIDKKVRECTWEELKQYPLLNSTETIPLFADVLRLMGTLPIICEIKVEFQNDVPSLCRDTLHQIQNHHGPVCIQSFHPLIPGWFRKNAPHIIRGQLSSKFTKKDGKSYLGRFMQNHLLFNFLGRPDYVAYNQNCVDVWGFRFCRKFFHVSTIGWTFRSIEKENSVGKAWFDSYIFERYVPESSKIHSKQS